MKVAVIQHALRESAAEDARALVHAVGTVRERERDVDLVVLPYLPSVAGDSIAQWTLDEGLRELSVAAIVPAANEGCGDSSIVLADLVGDGMAGAAGVAVGDSALSSDVWEHLLGARVHALVMSPGAENDLQAEAALELALALSNSVASLVIVAECDGAEVGDAGHGGSAIIAFGDVVAEALSGDDVLYADIDVPIAPPEPREPLPQLPTLLSQRLANHHGARLAVDYPADLSDGAGPA